MSRVLIVDDMPEMRSLLFRLLEHFGHEPACASDGEEALEILKLAQTPFDLVLTDWQMPRMDGIALCKAIREDESLCAIPIIMASSQCFDDEVAHALNSGATAFIPKPFESEDLNAMINETLAKAGNHGD